MAWTDPITFRNGDPLTAAQLNTFIRDNMNETATAKATTAGRFIAVSGLNQVTERQWARGYESEEIFVDGMFPRAENEEGDIYGPTATVETSGLLLILFDSRISMSAGDGNAIYAPSINGSMPDSSNYALRSGREGIGRCGSYYVAEVDPGLATVTMTYGVSDRDSIGRYAQRRVTVIPF